LLKIKQINSYQSKSETISICLSKKQTVQPKLKKTNNAKQENLHFNYYLACLEADITVIVKSCCTKIPA